MEIAKALILVADGGGEWPAAPHAPRQMFPLANRPILFHHLDALKTAGVLEVTILSERGCANAIIEAVECGHAWGLSVAHREWDSRAGLAGALARARGFIGDEPVLVQRGDALLRDPLHGLIRSFAREGLDAMTVQLREPASGPPIGHLLSPSATAAIIEAQDNSGQLTDAVRAGGGQVSVREVDGVLACEGGQERILESNRVVLEHLIPDYEGAQIERTRIQGAVQIAATATVRRSTIRGPVIIGAGAMVDSAYIGPYTAIGDRAHVEGTEIEHSIVLSEARLSFVGVRLESSIIGRRARIGRGFRLPTALRMSVGEDAEIVLA
jgi:glucose-1-phosphate thymidylyltransferase